MNRNYDRIIILCHPRGAGGNFLINCLSLNDQCVFRDSVLAEQQLTSGFNVEKKLSYLQTQLTKSVLINKWGDLDLGCCNLFGIGNQLYVTEYPEIIQTKFSSVVSRLIQQQKYLFIIAHTTQYLEAYLKFWVNARVIFFNNYHNFIQKRGYDDNVNWQTKVRPQLNQYWNTVRDISWPVNPPTTRSEFLQLPKHIQNELLTQFHGEIFRWADNRQLHTNLHDRSIANIAHQLGSRAYEWNVEKTFSGDYPIFFEELHQVANWIGVSIDASRNELEDYYKQWLHAIFKIKN
jgi:hypothetical protein